MPFNPYMAPAQTSGSFRVPPWPSSSQLVPALAGISRRLSGCHVCFPILSGFGYTDCSVTPRTAWTFTPLFACRTGSATLFRVRVSKVTSLRLLPDLDVPPNGHPCNDATACNRCPLSRETLPDTCLGAGLPLPAKDISPAHVGPRNDVRLTGSLLTTKQDHTPRRETQF